MLSPLEKNEISIKDICTLFHDISFNRLIYGIGNLGRSDDGLGIRFISEIENFQLTQKSDWLDSVKLMENYQLNIEDALEISNYDIVLFVDAIKSKKEIKVIKIEPSNQFEFSTHAMTISSILSLCQGLYHKNPECYLLTIPGQEWGISERLSNQAKMDLQRALKDFLNNPPTL